MKRLLLFFLLFIQIIFVNLHAVNRGFTNKGDDCFMNGSLQALSHVKRFRDVFLQEVKLPGDSKNVVAREFITFLKELTSSPKTTAIESWQFRQFFTCGGTVVFNRPAVDYDELPNLLDAYFKEVNQLIDYLRINTENTWEHNKERFEILRKTFQDIFDFLESLNGFYSEIGERLSLLKNIQLTGKEISFEDTWTDLGDVKLSEQQKKKPEELAVLFKLALFPLIIETSVAYTQFLARLSLYDVKKVEVLHSVCQSFINVVKNEENWDTNEDVPMNYIKKINKKLGTFHPVGEGAFKLGTNQNDPHEFFMTLFDILLKEKSIELALEKEYEFTELKNIACMKCKTVFSKKSSQSWLMLSLDKDQQIEPFNIVIKKIFDEEFLTEDNQYKCSICKSKQDAKTYVRLGSLPNVLCVQLKRYSFDWETMQSVKTHTIVPVPQEFSFAQDYIDAKVPLSSIYRLRSVVLHTGASSDSGHYTAFARDLGTGTWGYFDDSIRYGLSDVEMDKILTMGLFIPEVSSPGSIKQSGSVELNKGKKNFELSPDFDYESEFEAIIRTEAEEHVVVTPEEITNAQKELEKDAVYMKKIKDEARVEIEREQEKSKKKSKKLDMGDKGSIDIQVDAEVQKKLKQEAEDRAQEEKITKLIDAWKADSGKVAEFRINAKEGALKSQIQNSFQPYLLFYEKVDVIEDLLRALVLLTASLTNLKKNLIN